MRGWSCQRQQKKIVARPLKLLLLLVVAPLLPRTALARLGIPGVSQTRNGYDVELGTDAICWRVPSVSNTTEDNVSGNENNSSLSFFTISSPLVAAGIQVDLYEGVELLRACPAGNSLEAMSPVESRVNHEILRSGSDCWYNYTVTVTLNLTSLALVKKKGATTDLSLASPLAVSPTVISDKGPFVSVQILLCVLGKSGFCAPYIHDESNQRLAEAGESLKVNGGDRHGGTHVHSPYVFVELPPDQGPVHHISVNVPVKVNHPAKFFAVAALQVYLKYEEMEDMGNGGRLSSVFMRYDMANALVGDERLITYQAPPVILEVEDPIRYFSYVAIAVVASIIMFLLAATIRHRKHSVMLLTQGSFLIVFLVTALIATLASFLVEPVNDLYCSLSSLLIMIPLQLMYAITIGRLWRINAVISPLLVKTLRSQQSNWLVKRIFHLASLPVRICCQPGGKSRNLRKQVTNQQLALVIGAFTLPQVVIQVLALILHPSKRHDDLNDDESKGRAICSGDATSLEAYGFYVFGALILILLILAHSTRNLPSLFNETRVIFDSTVTIIGLFILCAGVIFATNDPTTSPGVRYLVSVALILSNTLNCSVRIILPKLQMIWRGEKVMVSQLVSDHKKAVKADDDAFSGPASKAAHNRTDTDWLDPKNTVSTNSNSQQVMESLSDFMDSEREQDVVLYGDALAPQNTSMEDSGASLETTGTMFHDEVNNYGELLSPGATASGRANKQMRASTVARFYDELPNTKEKSIRHFRNKIVVKQDHTPSRTLVLKMFNLQEQLFKLNERIMSGLAVSEEDWETVRRLNRKLNSTFQEDVEFDWEKRTTAGETTTRADKVDEHWVQETAPPEMRP